MRPATSLTRCNQADGGADSDRRREEIELVKNMIFRHADYTGSRRATEILLSWDALISRFVRVLPHDYKRVLEAEKGTYEIVLGASRDPRRANES